MPSSCWSGSPFSSPSKARPNLQYEPPLYCRCGLKSPLCVSRENGQQFFGCQRWKEGGCGYFMWKNALCKEDEVESDWNKNVGIEMKKMKSEFMEEIRQLRSDVEKRIAMFVSLQQRAKPYGYMIPLL
nr:DNA topoisomerase 3-alpha-like [Ipomoea batatas]